MTTETISEQNKKTVLAFYKEAHFDGDVDGAIARYVGDTYIQHTPAAEDGVEGLRAYINFSSQISQRKRRYSPRHRRWRHRRGPRPLDRPH